MTSISSPRRVFSISGYLVNDRAAGLLLSLVAGFVDTSAFIVLLGIFTAHVTANTKYMPLSEEIIDKIKVGMERAESSIEDLEESVD